MKYQLIKNKNIINGLELISDSDILNAFFHSFSTDQYLTLLQGLAIREGYLGDPKGLIFYHELDGEDFAEGHVFAEDEVEVYFHSFGEIILKENLFMTIALDYAKHLLKIHIDNLSFTNQVNKELDKIFK